MPDYDVLVLGGGSAGSAAARAAHTAGARTAMINDGELGGLCILRGCMPTKALLASAHAVHEARHLDPFGATLEGRIVPDFTRIMARKDEQVARFQRAKIAGIEQAGYTVIDGRGRFATDGAVEVDGRRITARRYVIATGSRAASIPIPGLDRVPVLTSDSVMRLERQPEALLVQGAGPIGLELAQFFARIGTRVTLVNRSPLLHGQDPDAGVELTRALAGEMELCVPGRIERVDPDGDGLIARLAHDGGDDSPQEVRADALLMAVGRHADLTDLGLDHVGLDGSRGYLAYGPTMRTKHPEIYVAGDATGSFQILHLATREGQIAGGNAAGADPELRMDYRLAIQVVFTDPPYARIGPTEDEARREGQPLVAACARFAETGRAITMGVRHGLWKLFADPRNGEILGASILGPRADELIHLIASLMHFRGSVDDILDLPWYHPTVSEVILDLARQLKPSIRGE